MNRLMSFLSILLLINILFTSINAECQSVNEENVDYYGNDIKYVAADNVHSCCDICSSDLSCVLIVYLKDTATCWLKSGFGFKLITPGRKYYFKIKNIFKIYVSKNFLNLKVLHQILRGQFNNFYN